MIRAGGVVFCSVKTKRICLFLRSHIVNKPFTWGFVGGKINKDEKILQGISREIREEIGFIPKYIKALPIDVYKNVDFIYYSLLVVVEDEFIPVLNPENGGYGWFNLDCMPTPLHQGAKQTLIHSNFKKLIKKICDEQLEQWIQPSPIQKTTNL